MGCVCVLVGGGGGVASLLRHMRPRCTEGEFRFDQLGWVMPNCTTTQKTPTKLEFLTTLLYIY